MTSLSEFPELAGKIHGWHHSRKFLSLRGNPMGDITLGNSKACGKSHGWHHSRKLQSLREIPMGDITLGNSPRLVGADDWLVVMWGRVPSRYIAVYNESSLNATVHARPSPSPPLLALSPLHRQEAGQRRARHSEYNTAAIAAAVL